MNEIDEINLSNLSYVDFTKKLQDLQKCNTIINLNISKNIITNNNVDYFCNIIKNNKLQKINMNQVKYVFYSLNTIMDAISNCQTLQELILSNHGYMGFEMVFDKLNNLNGLKKLNISNSNLCKFNIFYINLLKNCTLTELNLANNHLCSGSIEILCSYLETNTTLKTLDLYNNEIYDNGAKQIINLLKSNRTLIYINLINNKISPELRNVIREQLKQNQIIHQRAKEIRRKKLNALLAGLKKSEILIPIGVINEFREFYNKIEYHIYLDNIDL